MEPYKQHLVYHEDLSYRRKFIFIKSPSLNISVRDIRSVYKPGFVNYMYVYFIFKSNFLSFHVIYSRILPDFAMSTMESAQPILQLQSFSSKESVLGGAQAEIPLSATLPVWPPIIELSRSPYPSRAGGGQAGNKPVTQYRSLYVAIQVNGSALPGVIQFAQIIFVILKVHLGRRHMAVYLTVHTINRLHTTQLKLRITSHNSWATLEAQQKI